MNLLALAARNLARNRRRALLTGGVVVFGFASIALAGGFMTQSLEGLRDGTIRSGLGHLQIGARGAFERGADASAASGLADAAALEAIARADRDVAEVLPRIEFTGLVSDGRTSLPFLGVGVDPGREARVMDLARSVSSGRWLADRDQRAVVLGEGLAAALKVRAGDTVTLLATTADGTLNALDAEVAGLAAIPFRELDDRFLAAPLGLASDLVQASGRVSKLVVMLERDDGGAALSRLLGAAAAAGHPADGRTWEQLAPFYRQVRLLYAGIFGFMGIVLVVVVLLASANAMLMTATERTREIGTLRALGTRAAVVRRLFLAEGIVLAAAGCAGGAVLALVVRALLNRAGIVLPPPPGATRGLPLHVQVYGAAYAAGAVAMFATLALASWLPARRAARRPIIEALTHV